MGHTPGEDGEDLELLRAAQELLDLKHWKDSMQRFGHSGFSTITQADYDRRKPLAWPALETATTNAAARHARAAIQKATEGQP